MRIEDAHEGRALCAKQAEVSPVSNKSHKHALRAMWIDDCELWGKMHSRPDRWPQIVRFASGSVARRLLRIEEAHEARALWAKQAAAVEAPKGWRGEDSAKRSAAPEYRASEAQAGTKTPVRQGKPRVSLRTSEARRAEVASTRSEAQCAATQHRAAEGEHGAKTRIDYAALWNGGTAQP